MGRRVALVCALALSAACGREGSIGPPSLPAPPYRTPSPIALPPPAVRDARPVVWTASNGPVALRVVMTPRRPVVGDLVSFDIKMSYGQPPYRPGSFAYQLRMEEGFGESSSAACGGPPPGVKPRLPSPFDDNLDRKYRVFHAGSHDFELSAHPNCMPGAPAVSIKRTFDVVGRRPLDGLRWTGTDDTRQVDIVVAPKVPKEYQTMHLFAIFEDRTGEPFGWRMTFGDGRRPIAGGPACKPKSARAGGRYERHYARRFRHPAEYHVRVELARSCLESSERRGRVVVDEVVYIRPRIPTSRRFAFLPSHRYPPLHKAKLPPVRLAGNVRTGCVWLERVSDGKRLQVVWPSGTSRMWHPLIVFSDYSNWRAGKVRKDVSIIGVGPVDPLPKRCRLDDEALLLAPLPLPPPPKGR